MGDFLGESASDFLEETSNIFPMYVNTNIITFS